MVVGNLIHKVTIVEQDNPPTSMLKVMMNRLSMIAHSRKAGRPNDYSAVWLGCSHHMMGECPTSSDDYCDGHLTSSWLMVYGSQWRSMKSMADSQWWSKVVHWQMIAVELVVNRWRGSWWVAGQFINHSGLQIADPTALRSGSLTKPVRVMSRWILQAHGVRGCRRGMASSGQATMYSWFTMFIYKTW